MGKSIKEHHDWIQLINGPFDGLIIHSDNLPLPAITLGRANGEGKIEYHTYVINSEKEFIHDYVVVE